MKVEVTYTKAGAGFGSRETYGGRGGGKVKTETTILVPIGEHVMEEIGQSCADSRERIIGGGGD